MEYDENTYYNQSAFRKNTLNIAAKTLKPEKHYLNVSIAHEKWLKSAV